jgi:hypothetical protein
MVDTRAWTIQRIASLLHTSAGRSKPMAMLQAYFDDANTHGEALITAIGGWVADIEAWSSAEKAWNQTLDLFRPYGVEAYHWVEVQNKSGSWRGVPSTVMPEAQFMGRVPTRGVIAVPAVWPVDQNAAIRATSMV